MNLYKVLVLLMMTAIVFTFGCNKKEEPEPAAGIQVKAGFIIDGEITDNGWCYSHNQGILEMESLPYVEESTVMQNVGEGTETARVIKELVDSGHNVIFAVSFGFMDAMAEAAKLYPDVTFVHCSGYKSGPNFGNYFGRIEEARYLTGIVAGMMSKTNTLGYVAAYPIPEVVRGINSFALGAQSVNPDIEVRVAWTNSWHDPDGEMAVAKVLADSGADILTMHQNAHSVMLAAAQNGIYGISYHADMSALAPETILTGAIWNWGVYYKHVAENVYNGTWESSSDLWGMKEGMVDIASFADVVPDAVKNEVSKKREEIIDGTFEIFSGPIVDQQGTERIPAGRSATEQEQLDMSYFVKGVTGYSAGVQ